MPRAFSLFSAIGGAGLALAADACGNGDDSTSKLPVVPADASSEASDATSASDGPPADAHADRVADAAGSASAVPFSLDSATGMASLRLANWSADAPAIDFCLALQGTDAFQGPLLATRAAAIDQAGVIDAGLNSLAFPRVSSYLSVARGSYDVKVVAAGAADCSSTGILETMSLVTAGEADFVTVALVGAAHPQGTEPHLAMAAFDDDWQTPSGVIVRAINASPDLPRIDLGTFSKDTGFTSLLNNVAFGQASSALAAMGPLKADANGYVQAGPFSGATLAVMATGTEPHDAATLATPVTESSNVSIGPGAVVTVVFAGISSPSAGAASLQIVKCIDNAGRENLEGNCTTISSLPK